MDEDVRIRRATADDIPFLVEAICAAEKAGTDRLSYCRVFDLDESDFARILAAMLLEDLEGQELCISGFLIAESAGEPVGACCAWVEGAAGLPSTILKANLLLHAIEPAKVRGAETAFRALAELAISRDTGAVQIESVYVRPAARGLGIAGRLIERHLADLRASAPANKAQVILTTTNPAAQSAYAKLGFRATIERVSSNQRLLDLVPSLGKLLMEKPLIGEH